MLEVFPSNCLSAEFLQFASSANARCPWVKQTYTENPIGFAGKVHPWTFYGYLLSPVCTPRYNGAAPVTVIVCRSP